MIFWVCILETWVGDALRGGICPMAEKKDCKGKKDFSRREVVREFSGFEKGVECSIVGGSNSCALIGLLLVQIN